MRNSRIRTLLLTACLLLGGGAVQAQPETLVAEGSQVTQYLPIHLSTWGNKRPLLALPLPPGTWTLRYIETVRNNLQLEGRVFWLDQVEHGQVVGLTWASVWENGGRNWVPGARCTGTLLVRAREPGLNGGCFSVKASAFMTNSSSASQKRIRDMWDRAGLQYANRAIFLDGFFEKRGGAVVYLDYAVPTRALGIPDSMALNTSPERTLALTQAVQAYQAGAIEQWFRAYGETLNDHVQTSPSDRRLAASEKPPLLAMLRSAIAAHLSEEDRQAIATLDALAPPKTTPPTPAAAAPTTPAAAAPPTPAAAAPAVVPASPSAQELARMRAEVEALREELERTRRAQAADAAKRAEKPPEPAAPVPAPQPVQPPAPTEQAAATPKPPSTTAAPAQSRPKPATAAVRDVAPSKSAAAAPAKAPAPEFKAPPLAPKPQAATPPRAPIPEIREVQPRPAPPARKKSDQDIPEIKPVPQGPPKIPM